MQLLEREGVLAELAGHLEHAAGGSGRLVLLRGEAGVGKTALVRSFAARVRRRVRVLVGACDPVSTPRPLGPVVDIASAVGAPLAQAVAAAVEGTGGPVAVFAALLAQLGQGSQPSLLVVEDVHWADEGTLDLLRYLARRLGEVPVLGVVTYREDEVGPTHPVAVVLGDVASCPAVHRVALAPLSQRAVGTLAAGSGVDVAQLYRITGGNAFFVTEVLRASAEAIPRSVAEAVLGRLARLGGPARAVAEAVAVIGSRASVELLTVVAPQAGEAGLDQALAAGMLCAQGPGIGFRHELARLAVLEAIPAYQRIRWHARVLAALRARPIDADDLAQLADQAEEAGDSDAVLEFAPAAGAHAATLGAHRQAAAQYARALRHAAAVPAQQRAGWLEAGAFECYLSGHSAEAIASWQEVIILRRAQGERLREGDDLRWLSHILWAVGQTRQAKQAGWQALRVLEVLGSTRELAWAQVNLARLATYDYDPATVTVYADQAIALGLELEQPAVVLQGRLYAALARVVCFGRDWAELEEVWRVAMVTEGLADQAGLFGAIICWIAALHYDLPRLVYLTERTMAYCDAYDMRSFHLVAHGADALGMLHSGRWAHAAAAAGEVLARAAGLHPMERLLPLVTLALVRARRGEPGAGPLLDQALECAEPTDVYRLGVVWAARAEVAWLAGEKAQAVAEAEKGLKGITIHSDPWLVGGLARWIRLASAEQAAPLLVAEPFAAELAGDWQAAAEYWQQRDCVYDAALAQLGGDGPAVAQALATFQTLGAQPAAAQARKRLRALGLRPTGPHPSTRANPYGLTRRECEILNLLGKRLTDAQIAAQLVITPKTAGNHVSAILAKLGVHTRGEAAAKLNPPNPGMNRPGLRPPEVAPLYCAELRFS